MFCLALEKSVCLSDLRKLNPPTLLSYHRFNNCPSNKYYASYLSVYDPCLPLTTFQDFVLILLSNRCGSKTHRGVTCSQNKSALYNHHQALQTPTRYLTVQSPCSRLLWHHSNFCLPKLHSKLQVSAPEFLCCIFHWGDINQQPVHSFWAFTFLIK